MNNKAIDSNKILNYEEDNYAFIDPDYEDEYINEQEIFENEQEELRKIYISKKSFTLEEISNLYYKKK